MTGRRRAKYTHRWYEGGVKRQRSFDRKADRDTFAAEVRRRLQMRGVGLVDDDVTLGEFIETYWTAHAVPNLEASTRAGYATLWGAHIEPRLGAYELRQITPRLVSRFRQQLAAAGVGDPTIRKTLAVLQSVLALAEAEERIDSNPVAKIRKPPVAPPKQVAAIAPAVVEQLRAAMPSARDAAIVSILAYAGLRPEEVLALDVAAVGPRSLFVHRKNVDGQVLPYTKTRRHRAVELLAPLATDLREYMLAAGVRKGLLFARPDGAPWRKHDWDNWRNRVWQPACVDVGLGQHVQRKGKAPLYRGRIPYDLRGSFVSLMAWEGRTMLEVARLAGHSVQTCDRHYAGIFEGVDPAQRTSAEQAIREARGRRKDVSAAPGGPQS